MNWRTYLWAVLVLVTLGCGKSEETTELQTASSEPQAEEKKKIILFFGNSLTAGYGLEAEDALPGLVQQRIDSLGYGYRVINAGLSGETTASGLSRLDWFLEEEPEIFILELGGNDGLRGISLEETSKNLKAILQKVRSKYPHTHVILAGMQIPPNMGVEYTLAFKDIYPKVASEEKVTLIPFLLEGVAGNPDLNLPDGIHPTEEGHLIVFETVWPYIDQLISVKRD